MRLRDFEVLSFDCYGTLIDWETGISAALHPLRKRIEPSLGSDDVLATFARFEGLQQQTTPTKPYRDVLAIVYKRLAEAWGQTVTWGECETFGASIATWPPFPDSAEALAYLKRHCKLVILSNVDNASFSASHAKLGVAFDAIYTAEDTGAYKPDRAGFDYMLARLGERGIARDKILHTAQSLFHDHGVAGRLGLSRCFIDRHAGGPGSGATPIPVEVPTPEFRFESMAALVEAHRAEG